MNVVITVAFIAIIGMWATAVYSRLLRMRAKVKDAWKLLEADQTKVAAQHVYNAQVERYNAALESFPAYWVAPLSGLKPARLFTPKAGS